MALQIHHTDESLIPVRHARESVIPAGTGRLGLVSAYFLLMTLVAAGVACVSAVLALIPGDEVRLVPMLRPSVAMVCAIVLSFTSFQTARLIDEHRRSGAVLATGWFLLIVISYTQQISGIITLTLAIVGFGIMASAWRYLR